MEIIAGVSLLAASCRTLSGLTALPCGKHKEGIGGGQELLFSETHLRFMFRLSETDIIRSARASELFGFVSPCVFSCLMNKSASLNSSACVRRRVTDEPDEGEEDLPNGIGVLSVNTEFFEKSTHNQYFSQGPITECSFSYIWLRSHSGRLFRFFSLASYQIGGVSRSFWMFCIHVRPYIIRSSGVEPSIRSSISTLWVRCHALGLPNDTTAYCYGFQILTITRPSMAYSFLNAQKVNPMERNRLWLHLYQKTESDLRWTFSLFISLLMKKAQSKIEGQRSG